MTGPLADRIRPETLENFVGQGHLIAPGKLLYNLIHAGKISNMIFFGPSGTWENYNGKYCCKNV